MGINVGTGAIDDIRVGANRAPRAYLGSELVYSLTQDFALPASAYITPSSITRRWLINTNRPQIDAEFVPSGTSRYLQTVSIRTNQNLVILGIQDVPTDTGSGVRADLSADFESNGTVTLTLSTGESITLSMADYSDDEEPYSLLITDSALLADLTAIVNALSTTDGTESATFTLRL